MCRWKERCFSIQIFFSGKKKNIRSKVCHHHWMQIFEKYAFVLYARTLFFKSKEVDFRESNLMPRNFECYKCTFLASGIVHYLGFLFHIFTRSARATKYIPDIDTNLCTLSITSWHYVTLVSWSPFVVQKAHQQRGHKDSEFFLQNTTVSFLITFEPFVDNKQLTSWALTTNF